MDRFRYLDEDDIVNFDVGIGNDGRQQAINVTPILTMRMIKDSLKEDNLHIVTMEDAYGVTMYQVSDQNNVLQRRYRHKYRLNMQKTIYQIRRREDNMDSTKMRELTISDIKELVEGKKVKAHLVSAMLIEPMDAVVTALPASKEIESIRGNESEIEIEFPNTMGFLYISIGDDAETEEDPVIDQGELCQYIKDRLERVSKLTVEDIDLILNLEMEFLHKRGIVD